MNPVIADGRLAKNNRITAAAQKRRKGGRLMGMSRYYRNIFGVPKDGPPPQKPEAVTVAEIPEVSEMTLVADKPEKAVAMKKKIGAKKKK